jgi:hypothetical protein
MSTCAQCRAEFTVYPEDRTFYDEISPTFGGKKFALPDPVDCPDCRHQRRCAFRNERTLYTRSCDLCKRPIITIFSGDQPFPVYCPECWWGDKWDPFSFGREIDFNRPFFEQFRELRNKVPRLSLNNTKHVNSEYCNQCVGNKNCYLLFAADDNEDSMYGYWINRCKDTFNSSNLADCTLCADLIDSESCYQCVASQDLVNCSDCFFSYDLIGCQNCFGCANLRNKQYYMWNQPKTREEYLAELSRTNIGSFSSYETLRNHFLDVRRKAIHKYAHILRSENCIGDYISNSKDCFYTFDAFESEACRYAFNLVHQHYKNMDVSYVTETRSVLECMSLIGERIFFSMLTWYSMETWYSDLIQSSQNIFGCVALHRKKYCILNKQYSEKEYATASARLIGHMQKTGEWGYFFPVTLSPFAYNETVAMEEFPLRREEIEKRGWRWKDHADERQRVSKTIPASDLPDSIAETPDDIVDWAIQCGVSSRPYRVIKPELAFYRRIGIPVPRLHPDERYKQLRALRNPRQLWARTCMKCGAEIHSTYASDRPETVYCEKCYRDAVS